MNMLVMAVRATGGPPVAVSHVPSPVNSHGIAA